MEKWFQLAIAQGLRSLLVLGLDRQPAAEVLPETIRAWTDDLWHGRGWSEADVPRIEYAFRTLRKTSRLWPQMADFIESLPPLPKPVVLPPPEISSDERERRRINSLRVIDETRKALGL